MAGAERPSPQAHSGDDDNARVGAAPPGATTPCSSASFLLAPQREKAERLLLTSSPDLSPPLRRGQVDVSLPPQRPRKPRTHAPWPLAASLPLLLLVVKAFLSLSPIAIRKPTMPRLFMCFCGSWRAGGGPRRRAADNVRSSQAGHGRRTRRSLRLIDDHEWTRSSLTDKPCRCRSQA